MISPLVRPLENKSGIIIIMNSDRALSSGSPQRWTCRACQSRNTAQFARCVACDCINPETLYPKTFAAVVAAGSGASTSPLPTRPTPAALVAAPPAPVLSAEKNMSSPKQSGAVAPLSPSYQTSSSVSRYSDTERLERQLERAAEINKALGSELKSKDSKIDMLERDNLAQREELKALSGLLIEVQHRQHEVSEFAEEQVAAEAAVVKELEAVKEELLQLKQSQPRETSVASNIAAEAQLDSLVKEVTSLRDAFHDSHRADREVLSRLVTEQHNRSVDDTVQRLEAENHGLREKAAALQQKHDEVVKQRDDFAHDVRFNLAMLAECQEERASLKAKLFEIGLSRSGGVSTAKQDSSNPAPPAATAALADSAAASQALQAQNERVLELQKLVKILENQLQSTEQSKQESLASLQDRLDSASFLEEQLKSAQFVNGELRKQCDTLREKITNKDFDIGEAARHLEEAERKLLAERDFHDRARKDVETLEKQLESSTVEWRARVESLNRQLNDHQAAQAELLERYDALEISADDLRAALADALDALASRAGGPS